MKIRLTFAAILFLFGPTPRVVPTESPNLRFSQESKLVPPTMLKRDALEAGNPLATYAAMLELESQYLNSKIFADFYRETRFNFEEFFSCPEV